MRFARRVRRGFTLIEAALVTVIVGFGVVGMLKLMAAGTMANGDAAELTTAMMLANNIRETTQMTTNFSFASPTSPTHWGLENGESSSNPAGWDDLDDFDGASFTPPIDARRQQISAYANWTQSVSVQSVNPQSIWTTISHNGLNPSFRPLSKVTVTISHAGHVVTTVNWMVAYAP